MDNQENIISSFNSYARQIMEEHTVAIKQRYSLAPESSEERLRVFNEHLDALKTELQKEIKEVVQVAKTELRDTGVIQARLNAIYNANINDFFKKEF